MKRSLFLVFTFLSAFMTYGQDISGAWNGTLAVSGTQLRLVFNITKTPDGYSSTMDSPDQGATGIPVTTITFENLLLKIELAPMQIEYSGKLENDVFVGNFKQGGQSFPMNLSKEKIEKEIVLRPQEPAKPYPYYSEEISFENKKEAITLSGTLTMPAKDGNYPVVILISGSGPQNRDEELLGHKPFLVLSDYLTRQGIAVLRYDDRGTGKSNGDFKKATTQNFASDAESAVDYLLTRKEINKKKIGLIGHSEGGIIAPIVAARSKNVSYIILLAGTGIPGGDLLLLQKELIERASGVSEEEIKKGQESNKTLFAMVSKSADSDKLTIDVTSYFREQLKADPSSKPAAMSEEDFLAMETKQVTSPWMQYFIKYDPSVILKDVKCPVLALNGSKDLQVPSKVNLAAIKAGLEKGGNKNVSIKELPGLNHLFQECSTGSPDEYRKIEQTFSPVALKEVSDWIMIQIK